MDLDKIKREGWVSVSEYQTALSYFDGTTNTGTYSSVKNILPEIFSTIHRKYGTGINMKRLSFLIMKDYGLRQNDAREVIRSGIDHGYIGLDDTLRASFDKKDVVDY